MEQNTKNFDRNIEQMMNEHEVAPPFGMWNRISSELGAMPAAVAAAGPPVAASLIPKRAMTGIIAAALVIGASLVTGYFVNNAVHTNKAVNATVANTTVAATTKPATASNTNTQTVGVKTTVQPLTAAVAKVKTKPAIAASPVQATIQAAQQVQPTINEPVSAANVSPVVLNNNTDVPTPIEPVAQNVQEPQTYYFPPIDVSTPEKTTTPAKPAISNKAHTNDGASVAANTDDDKPKRKRFHPARKHDWGYMNINR